MSQGPARAKLVMACPNPKLQQWLEEALDEARIRNDSKRVSNLKKALASLRKYPVRLKSARECLILDKFSSKLVEELEGRERREEAEWIAASAGVENLGQASQPDCRVNSNSSKSPSPRKTAESIATNSNLVLPTSVVESLIVPSKNSKKRKCGQCTQSPESEVNDTPAPFEPFTLESFEVVLLVDTAEQGFLTSVTKDDAVDVRIKYEVRHLKVGDYAWIARGECGRELMLPYIVERKRLDDVMSSIKDGRFSEQKFRLKMSKIPNVILLVEYLEMRGDTKTIYQAIANTMVQGLFTVKETKNNIQAFRYLLSVTSFLTSALHGKILERAVEFLAYENLSSPVVVRLPEFKSFISGLGKIRSFTSKEMFTKQLVQLNGLSADKAWTITSKYVTPMAFIEAAAENGPLFLADLEYGLLNRRIGPTISSVLHKFYSTSVF